MGERGEEGESKGRRKDVRACVRLSRGRQRKRRRKNMRIRAVAEEKRWEEKRREGIAEQRARVRDCVASRACVRSWMHARKSAWKE